MQNETRQKEEIVTSEPEALPPPAEPGRMRIQFVFNFCAHYRIRFFEHFARLHDVRYLFFSDGGETYNDGRGGMHTGAFEGRYLRGFNITSKVRVNPSLFRELWFAAADIIIKCINGPLPLMLAYTAAKSRGIPFILWTGIWHDLDTTFHRMAAPLVQRIYNGADAIVVYGDHVKAHLVEKGVDGSKIFPAYQAHDLSRFVRHVDPPELERLKRSLGIRARHVILFVGRFVPEKGLDYLIDAFKALGRDDTALLLIGAGETEPALRKRLDGVENAFIMPYVPNPKLYRYYALADILVLPSITTPTFKEPWGFVVNEAMCQRTAIVATDAVGAARGGLVEHDKHGIVVPERSSEALTGALQRLLSDPSLLQQMQEAAFEKISSWDVTQMAAGFQRAIAHALKTRKMRRKR